MKKGHKPKAQSGGGEKSLLSYEPDLSFHSAKRTSKTIPLILKYKKYLPFVILPFLVVGLAWQLSQLWIVRVSFSQATTYPEASVLGTDIGNLNINQLNDKLAMVKSEFENRKISLINNKDRWTFDSGKLGVTIDVRATSQSIWRLNKLSLNDKYRLLTGNISSVVAPTILVNGDDCTKSLAVISIPQVEPADALVYYDQGLKIKPDQLGTKFSATLTCSELTKTLATGLADVNVSFDTTSPGLTRANLEPKLSQIQSMVGESLSLKSNTYEQTLTTEQLLALLEISKKDSEVQVGWSSAKLDEIVNGIADKVNTYESGSASGACQYIISDGGNWLDKAATKKIFTDLGTDSSRSYTLPIAYHAPVVGTIKPVASGNSGTIYLTFDDGLNYGNQIMNYAACYGVKITFFELGELANRDTAGLRRAIAEGHAVQSHGNFHALYDYGQRSYDWQYNDIAQSITNIQNITGVRPTYFRPPGGNRSSTTYDAAAANGVHLILWGVSSGDGANIGTSATCSNVLARAFDGASVLLHSSKGDTAAAVPCIIEGLAAQGYNMQALR